MRLLILSLLVAVASSTTTVNPNLLTDIFGPPPTPTPAIGGTTKGLEDIRVDRTDSTSQQTNEKGQPCQCLPYYVCNANYEAVNISDPSLFGANVLDIRFGEDNPPPCTESQEVCCVILDKTEATSTPAPRPKPSPTPPAALKACGYRNPNGIGAQFQGPSTQFGEYPWVVALLDAKNGTYAGVGALIHPQVVITGAHIAYKYGPGNLIIRAGEWDTQTTKEILSSQERTVAEMQIHPEFNYKNLKNDIALLRLEKPVDLADHINIICMPEPNEVFDSHKNCVANGWGKDSFGLEGVYAVILKKVEVDMVAPSRCELLLKRTRLGSHFKLHDSFICAGGEAGKDTCQGDGGAPLACPIGNNRYKLTGMVAWGIGCGQQDVPAVYTNVSKFKQWVQDKMQDWGLTVTTYIANN